jgi:hypothetical protein
MSIVYYKRTGRPKPHGNLWGNRWNVVDAVYSCVPSDEWISKHELARRVTVCYCDLDGAAFRRSEIYDALVLLEEQKLVHAKQLDDLVNFLEQIRDIIREEVPTVVLMNSSRLKKLAGYD